jgi:acetyl-CoA carboxylase biotin carboxyl carrier protein
MRHRGVVARGLAPWSIARITVRQYLPPAASEASEASEKEERVPDVNAHITGTVWKIECEVGQAVEEGDTLLILESMKMEMPLEAEDPGTVAKIVCEEGQPVSEGDTLVILE